MRRGSAGLRDRATPADPPSNIRPVPCTQTDRRGARFRRGSMARLDHVPPVAEDLARRLAELERRNAELRDFAHLTAHDLKEPLSTIALFADVLATAHAQDLNPGGRRLLERLEAGVERMRLTIDTALAGADYGEHPFAERGHGPGGGRRPPGPGREHRDRRCAGRGGSDAGRVRQPPRARAPGAEPGGQLAPLRGGAPAPHRLGLGSPAGRSAGSSRWPTPAAASPPGTSAPGRASASGSAGRSRSATAARSRSRPGRGRAPPWRSAWPATCGRPGARPAQAERPRAAASSR